MFGAARVASALALVIAFIGLPTGTVLCDVICPITEEQGRSRHDAREPTIEPIHAAAACHEAGQGVRSAPRPTHRDPDAATASAISHASPGLGCDHPLVAAAPSTSWGTRMLPTPTLAAVRATVFDARAWRGGSAMVLSRDRLTYRRARVVHAFSPVLRI